MFVLTAVCVLPVSVLKCYFRNQGGGKDLSLSLCSYTTAGFGNKNNLRKRDVLLNYPLIYERQQAVCKAMT